jgi:2-phosphoglycerate kinase
MNAHPSSSSWIVTLVCGASGVGKSSIAVRLASRYGVPLAEADDIVTALKALTTPEQMPTLHLWDNQPDAREWAPPRIAELTIEVAEELRRGFEAVIADHVESATPVVMEGDYLLPALGVGFGAAVRAVVISEPDENRIVLNYLSREAGAGEQRLRARVSALLDAELSTRAAQVAVPVVAARPWTDGLERVDAALRLGFPPGCGHTAVHDGSASGHVDAVHRGAPGGCAAVVPPS